jgi:hypothetical protein
MVGERRNALDLQSTFKIVSESKDRDILQRQMLRNERHMNPACDVLMLHFKPKHSAIDKCYEYICDSIAKQIAWGSVMSISNSRRGPQKMRSQHCNQNLRTEREGEKEGEGEGEGGGEVQPLDEWYTSLLSFMSKNGGNCLI